MNLEAITDHFRWSHAWASPSEVKILCDHLTNEGIKSVIEIGTNNGFTASCMATTGATIKTFDLMSFPKLWEHTAFPYPELSNNITFEHTPSPECFKTLIRPNEPVLFFIDGDHSSEAVRLDFKCITDIARTGDLIFLHDIWQIPTVKEFWEELVTLYPDKTTTFVSRNGIGLYRP